MAVGTWVGATADGSHGMHRSDPAFPRPSPLRFQNLHFHALEAREPLVDRDQTRSGALCKHCVGACCLEPGQSTPGSDEE